MWKLHATLFIIRPVHASSSVCICDCQYVGRPGDNASRRRRDDVRNRLRPDRRLWDGLFRPTDVVCLQGRSHYWANKVTSSFLDQRLTPHRYSPIVVLVPFLHVGTTLVALHKAQVSGVLNGIWMKLGRIVNTYRLTSRIYDMMPYFQDDGHDVRPPSLQQRPPAAR